MSDAGNYIEPPAGSKSPPPPQTAVTPAPQGSQLFANPTLFGNQPAASDPTRLWNPAEVWRQVPAIAPGAAQAPTSSAVPGAVGQTPTAPAGGGIPPGLFESILVKEGSGDQSISPAGAIGKSQIMPSTAAQYGVSRDQLFDPAINRQTGQRIVADLWQKYRDPTAVMVAYNAGPGVADKWLASGKNPNVLPAETQKYIGVAGGGAGAQTFGSRIDAAIQNMRSAGGKVVDEQLSLADKAMAAATEMKGSLGEQAARVKAALDKSDAAQEAAMKFMQKSPEQPEINGFKNAAGLATVVGILGGLFTRSPMRASLNAAAAAIEAYNDGDREKYKRSYQMWEKQSDFMFKIANMNAQRLKDVLYQENLEQNEKTALLDTILRAQGQRLEATKFGWTVEKNAAEVIDKQETANQAWQKHQDEVAHWNQQIQADFDKKPEAELRRLGRQEFFTKNGRWPSFEEDKVITAESVKAAKTENIQERRLIEEEKLFDRLKADWAADPKNAGKTLDAHTEAALRAEAHGSLAGRASSTGTLSSEAIDIMADQYLMGDTKVITSLPRSGPVRVQLENRIAEKVKELPDAAQQIVMNRIRMVEAESAARTAGRITMNTELYSTEAERAGQQVIETSKLFPRTEYPLVNKALAAYETNTGDPNVIKFGFAMNALLNAYGKMTNPTGTGVHDADKDRFAKIMDRSLSQGQIEAGVQQVQTEGRIVANAAVEAQRRVLGQLAPHAAGAPPPAPSQQEGGDLLRHVKEAIAAGAPRDAARKKFLDLGGDASTFDREVPP